MVRNILFPFALLSVTPKRFILTDKIFKETIRDEVEGRRWILFGIRVKLTLPYPTKTQTHTCMF